MRIHREVPLALRTRRAVLAAGAAALVGSVTLGVVSLNVASAQPAPPFGPGFATADFVTADAGAFKEQRDKFVNTLAGKLGVASDKLEKALKETQQEVGPGPLLFPGGVAGFGVGVQGTAISITSDLAPAAKTIGIGEDQLRRELAGKSLTDVARAHNVDPDKVANAIKSTRVADLDKAVQAGKLPADLANRMKSHLDAELDMLMTITRPADGGVAEFNVRIVRNADDGPGT